MLYFIPAHPTFSHKKESNSYILQSVLFIQLTNQFHSSNPYYTKVIYIMVDIFYTSMVIRVLSIEKMLLSDKRLEYQENNLFFNKIKNNLKKK